MHGGWAPAHSLPQEGACQKLCVHHPSNVQTLQEEHLQQAGSYRAWCRREGSRRACSALGRLVVRRQRHLQLLLLALRTLLQPSWLCGAREVQQECGEAV